MHIEPGQVNLYLSNYVSNENDSYEIEDSVPIGIYLHLLMLNNYSRKSIDLIIISLVCLWLLKELVIYCHYCSQPTLLVCQLLQS